MATAHKKSAARKPAKKARPAVKAKAQRPKPAAKKPAARPAGKQGKPAAKPAARVIGKPAVAGKAAPRVVGKPAVPGKPAVIGKPAVAGKAAPRVVGRPAVPGKPAVVGKPAVAGKVAPRVVGKPAVPGKPGAKVVGKPAVPNKPRRLVPATAEAKAKANAARAARPTKGKASTRPAPEVRPLGVLPPSAQAKPRVPTTRPVGPSRPLPLQRGAARTQLPTRKGDDRLTPDDLKHFEQRLLEERTRIMREMGHLENTVLKVNPRDASGELSGYSFHMADAGTDSMEREKAFDIASKEGRLLLEIDDALRRVYNGTYGICELSGKPISRARLEALPWARLSLEEQEKLERKQRAGRAAPAAEE